MARIKRKKRRSFFAVVFVYKQLQCCVIQSRLLLFGTLDLFGCINIEVAIAITIEVATEK